MIAILKAHPSHRMTSKQIAMHIFDTFPKECDAKRARSEVLSSDEDLIGQIAAELGVFWRQVVDGNPHIQYVETRPREFYYDEGSIDSREEIIPNPTFESLIPSSSDALREKDLYPLLGSIVFNEMRCYSMRINESAGGNTRGLRGNHWLYPDLVGMIPLSDKWCSGVSTLADTLATERVHLVSFEVKKDIKRSDVREYFFQTVSNSAWANYAYLAAGVVKGNAYEELALLCSSYGVGFIEINMANPENSTIKIPAVLKESIDVNGLNRLVVENPDAQEFVENVSIYIKTGRLKPKDWNLVPDED